jgi:demethylmenaquinone methyltransferase/2-methoxy-6-polyprenyl-1,4-benzoquinol methylase
MVFAGVAKRALEFAADGTQPMLRPQAPAEDRVRQDTRDENAAADPRFVRRVFASVATRYDLMNDLMSFGTHRLWKNVMVRHLAPRRGGRYLDVAGGTGDVAARIARAGGRVTVCDINAAMLAVGRRRQRRLGEAIDWVQGDATALPFPARSFDGYAIAFGLRNVADIARALAEARRVLAPGGRYVCLEFSHVVLPLLGEMYARYSDQVIPRLGALVAGDRAAYQYLVDSIRQFPAQDRLAAMMTGAGLDRVRVFNLAGGIVALHTAWRL